LDSLKGILSDNFKVYYCTESFDMGPKSLVKIKVPMVSFCDIPLSQVRDHLGKYGQYGIGLKKNWAISNKLNPILYLTENSQFGESLNTVFASLNKYDGKDADKISRATIDILRFAKSYEANLVRRGVAFPKYRFYDEREWRYVPPHDSGIDDFLLVEEYEKDRAKYDVASSNVKLVFEPQDIRYLILRNDDEIGESLTHLRNAKGSKFSYSDIERLGTRILTSEQIVEDM
jgi:hypothetical protein